MATPSSTARRIDHVVHAVADLDEAASAYEALGFVVTPRADHPFGTSNRLVVLERSYIELVTVTRPELVAGGFADQVARFLQDGSGLVFLVLGSDYASADHAALQRIGLAVGDVLTFERPAPLIGGESITARFSLVFVPGFPNLGLFLCQHHTPEAVWHRAALAHPNGAQRLARVTGIGNVDPEQARRLAFLIGSEPVEDGDELRFPLDGSELVLSRGRSSRGAGPILTGLIVTGVKERQGATIAGVDIELTPDD